MKSESTNTGWIKSARSSDQGDCVELRRHSGAIEVRDSKDPEGPRLHLSAGELAVWLDAAKSDAFDHLV